MIAFYDVYDSLDELYNSILCGNEIEFLYNKKHFYILPFYGDGESVVGVCFGEAYKDNEVVCLSANELYGVILENNAFGKIISEIEITWRNF